MSRNDPDQNALISRVVLSHVHHTWQKCSDQLWNSGIVVTPPTKILVKNTGIPVKTPILALIKKQIYSEDDLEKPRGQFPYSPKLVSFPCSLRRLIWVYAVCIGLSVQIFRFFKFLICASFVLISDEKRLYKISLFFSRTSFPPQFHVTYRYKHVVS